MNQYGRSFNISYKEFLEYSSKPLGSEILSLGNAGRPLDTSAYRKSVYMVTFGYAIYRIAGTGKLALKKFKF